MSELIITPKSLEEIRLYNNADCYLIGNSDFCVRYNHSFSNAEVMEALKIVKATNKKLYININKIFQENELTDLKTHLVFLKQIDVDGIMFADYAVLRICKELGIESKCIMFHETYPLNTNDIEILLSFGMKGLIISKEVEFETLKKACKYENIGMIAFGHIEMFNSKRKFLETYNNQNNLDLALVGEYDVSVKEMTRDDLYPIFQDKNGTNIFTSFVYCALKEFKELSSLNMKYFILDSIFLDAEYMFEVLNMFDAIRKGQEVDIEKFYQESKYPLGSGFLHTDVGLIK